MSKELSIEDFEEVSVPYFSTGAVLIPRGWTVDSARYAVGPTGVEDLETKPQGESLPTGCSSNTVFMEEYRVSGATLSLTEVFVPYDVDKGETLDEAVIQRIVEGATKGSLQKDRNTTIRVQEIKGVDTERNPRHDRGVMLRRESLTSLASVLTFNCRVFLVSQLEGAPLPPISVLDHCRNWVAERYVSPSTRPVGVPTIATTEENHSWWGSSELGSVALHLKHSRGVVRVRDSTSAFRGHYHLTGDVAFHHKTAVQLLLIALKKLQLDSDHLLFSAVLASEERALLLGTVPLVFTNSTALDYLSVEMAFEAHLKQCGVLYQKSHTTQRFSPSEEYYTAVKTLCQESKKELPGGKEHDYSLSDFLYLNPIPRRQSTYLVRLSSAEREDEAEISFVVHLMPPLVSTNSAVVLATPLLSEKEEMEEEKRLAMCSEVGKQFEEGFYLFYPLSRVWSTLPQAKTSGSAYKAGQLVLMLPSDDVRYAGSCVSPSVAQIVNSLGALTLCVPKVVNSLNQKTYSAVSVAFTLLSDGCTAEDYIEDAVTEYLYDSGRYVYQWLPRASHLSQGSASVEVLERRKHEVSVPGSHHKITVVQVWIRTGDGGAVFLTSRRLNLGQLLVTSLVTGKKDSSEQDRKFFRNMVGGNSG